MPTITPIYAALLALLYLVLSARVIRQRPKARAAIGDGGDPELQRRIRAHGNFAEYAPLLILLLLLCELVGAPGFAIHIIGLLTILARVGHAYFISQTPEPLKMRVVFMGLTFGLIAVMALGLLGHALF